MEQNEKKPERSDCLVHKYNVETCVCALCGKKSLLSSEQLKDMAEAIEYHRKRKNREREYDA